MYMTGMDTIAQTVIRTAHRFLVGWWFLTRPNTHGVKCLVVCADNKVLLVKQSYGDSRWSVPGGGVKKYETNEHAAKREMLEEVGIDAAIQYIGTYQQKIEYKNDTVFVYAVTLSNRPRVTIDNREVINYGWFSMKNLPTQVRPSVKNIVDMYIASLSIP